MGGDWPTFLSPPFFCPGGWSLPMAAIRHNR